MIFQKGNTPDIKDALGKRYFKKGTLEKGNVL